VILNVTHLARICHEANRALQQALNDPAIPIAAPWVDCDNEQHASVINGVIARRANPSMTAAQMHENWSAFKREHGWVYGPVKDDTARTHPCLVPYVDLPAGDKAKDRLFSAIVEALS
jgi:hypothetical protein